MPRGRYIPEERFKPHTRDGEKAIAAAMMRLLNVPDEKLLALTAEQVARDHNLSIRRAEYMLGVEVGRRLRGQADD